MVASEKEPPRNEAVDIIRPANSFGILTALLVLNSLRTRAGARNTGIPLI